MTVQSALRSSAVLLALGGVADPACTWMESEPAPIEVRAASQQPSDLRLAEAVRARLASALRGGIDLDSPQDPAAIVVAGEPLDFDPVPSGVPVSNVTEAGQASRNVRVHSISAPLVMRAGWATSLSATLDATGMAGQTSVIVLEHGQVELGRVQHRWTSASETFEAVFPYVPPVAGTASMRILARALDTEITTADNHEDFRVMVEDRALKILVHDPRPSWTTAFVRRALEEEPLFEVASLVRPADGIEVRTGAPPERLTLETLERFDAVIVGAPEELNESEIDALESFARVRGGTFILIPDRRPAGPYVHMIPAASFEERLLERPMVARGLPGGLRGTEFAVPIRPGAAVETRAGLDDPKGRVPIVISWPLGAGRGVWSGALDAWRHRAADAGFAAFWRAHVAAGAASAPRRVEAALDPGLALPGQTVTLRVRVRPTDFAMDQGSIRIPIVSARYTDAKGSTGPIRLWPTEEAGVLEGRFKAPAPGRYDVQVSTRDEARFNTVLIVSADARTATPVARNSQHLLIAASGGVSATAGDLSALESHLSGLSRAPVARSIRPARSLGWTTAFALLLCAEWGLRRRGGAR
jgi:hypothetical protein